MTADLAAMVERLVPGSRDAGVLEYVEKAVAGEPGLAELQGFGRLTPERQDEVLGRLEGTSFFELVRQRAIEGFFAGPAGWALLGYPGPRAVWTEDDQALG